MQGEIRSTRLRYISAKDPDLLSVAISSLPFKVEVKGPVFDGKRWFIWFVIPDNVPDTFSNINI